VIRKRVPVSAFRLSQALGGSNALAKPSVNRVDAKAAFDVRKLSKLARFPGNGDPCWAHTNAVENPAYRPRTGVPTVNMLVVTEIRLELNPRNAWIGVFGLRSN